MRLTNYILKTIATMRQLHLDSVRQIVWQVSSQSPGVRLRHEVHYSVVCTYAEVHCIESCSDKFFL
jgi:hypothetical protein